MGANMTQKSFRDREETMASRRYEGNERVYIEEVLKSGNLSSLSGGTFTSRFEAKFAETLGVTHAVAMNSCMSALHAALICAKAGPGTEVICDAEFVFGALAVLYNSAIPVFVDVNPVTHNMAVEKLEAAITERTRAIIATHAWGLPAQIDWIVEIGHRHNVTVIEDCAESVLATYKGRCTGTWGDVGCFSFQASKQLSLGDGGMATTNDDELRKGLANHAGQPTFHSVALSMDFNYRMNEQTAAIGLAQTETLAETIRRLEINAAHYDAAVQGCQWLALQRGPDPAHHSFYHWAATFTGDELGLSLQDFKEILGNADVGSVSVGYTQMAAYQHPVIRERRAHAFRCAENEGCRQEYEDGHCPVAEHVVPRLVLGYLVEPEETAKAEAEKLHNVVRQLAG